MSITERGRYRLLKQGQVDDWNRSDGKCFWFTIPLNQMGQFLTWKKKMPTTSMLKAGYILVATLKWVAECGSDKNVRVGRCISFCRMKPAPPRASCWFNLLRSPPENPQTHSSPQQNAKVTRLSVLPGGKDSTRRFC